MARYLPVLGPRERVHKQATRLAAPVMRHHGHKRRSGPGPAVHWRAPALQVLAGARSRRHRKLQHERVACSQGAKLHRCAPLHRQRVPATPAKSARASQLHRMAGYGRHAHAPRSGDGLHVREA